MGHSSSPCECYFRGEATFSAQDLMARSQCVHVHRKSNRSLKSCLDFISFEYSAPLASPQTSASLTLSAPSCGSSLAVPFRSPSGKSSSRKSTCLTSLNRCHYCLATSTNASLYLSPGRAAVHDITFACLKRHRLTPLHTRDRQTHDPNTTSVLLNCSVRLC